MNDIQSRIAGGFWGLLVGDALGVPYEFKSAREIPSLEQIDFSPPAGYPRTYASIPVGTWSDDGSMALCLLSSLLDCNEFDADDFARRLLMWENGEWWVDNHKFDMGIATGQAISRLKRGVPPLEAGPRGDYDNGNGSLMRVLPLALWHRGDDAQLARDAMTQSLVTHGHPRSQVCCALYCLWARELLNGASDGWESATETLRGLVQYTPHESELEFHVRPDDFSSGNGSGYVVDALRSARWVMRENSYEDVVKSAVALGKDTDTTACIAGGVAGVREGLEAIPSRWMEQLRGREIADLLLEQLLQR
jgi:ADP-ribosylglycohydrolase